MGLSWQEYWSGVLFPSPGDLPNPGAELESYVSCTGRWVLYHLGHLGSCILLYTLQKVIEEEKDS